MASPDDPSGHTVQDRNSRQHRHRSRTDRRPQSRGRTRAPSHRAGKRCRQHEEGRARQVEIGHHHVDGTQAVARRDEQGSLPLKCSSNFTDLFHRQARIRAVFSRARSQKLRIGCVESLSATLVPQVLLRFSEQYPRVVVHIDGLTLPSICWAFANRKYDCILVRLMTPLSGGSLADDVNVELLFEDRLVVAAGINNRFARRRKIDLAELADEPSILPPPGTWHYARVQEAFQARRLGMPKG